MADYILAMTTCPEEKAEEIALKLVESRECACVNIVHGMTSIYHWDGKIEKTKECLLLMKTESHLTESLLKSLKEVHQYEVPEYIVVPIKWGSKDYLDWISENVYQP